MKLTNNILYSLVDLAKKSNVRRSKMAAAILDSRGNVVCMANNVVVMGHPSKWTLHAEEMAIAKAVRKRVLPNKLDLIVIRYKPSTDKLSLAKPCINCQRLIEEAGLNTYFTDENGDIEKWKS